jgi:hypothetical protein
MAATTGGDKKRGWSLFLLGCVMGGVVGFGAGVASVKAAREAFTSAFQDEHRADVDKPQFIDRKAFRLQYPGNWKVNTAGSGYDPDHQFSIESPGQSFVLLIIDTGGTDPKIAVDAHVRQQTSKLMRDATRTPFEWWGAHRGEGVLLTGKMLGLTPGTIRIFAFLEGERTVTVVESTFDDDRAMVAPGFALIERTFQMKDGG